MPYAQAGPGGGGAAPEQDTTPTGTLSCAIPSGVEVFAGLGATMTVTAGESANVVTVPLTAVQGSVKGMESFGSLRPEAGQPQAAREVRPAPVLKVQRQVRRREHRQRLRNSGRFSSASTTAPWWR
ncbi:hypothetical protein ACW0JT_23040 [Arthrobacter sp. SA17]